MTTSQTFELSKPKAGEKVPAGTLGFARAKLRNDLYDLIVRAFRLGNVTQAELARRLGKDPAWVNRRLGAPGNWTLETVSDLLFAINGNFVSVSEFDAIAAKKPNEVPDWLVSTIAELPFDDSPVVDFSDYRTRVSSSTSPASRIELLASN